MSQAEKQLFDFLWTGCFFRSSDLMIWESSIVSQVLHSVSVRNSWPTHDEGSMVVTSKQLPGISLTESIAIGNEIERTIKSCGRLIEIKVRLFVAFGVLLSPQYQQAEPCSLAGSSVCHPTGTPGTLPSTSARAQAPHGAQTQVLQRFCPFADSFKISLQRHPRVDPRRPAV
jgi:hypothetical protein